MSSSTRVPIGEKQISSTRFYLEEAWDNWLKEVLVLVFLGLLGLLYYLGVFPERVVTGLLAAGLVLIPARLTAVHAVGFASSTPGLKGGLAVTACAALVGALLLAGGLVPGSQLLQTTLNHSQADVELQLPAGASDLEVVVEGHPVKEGESPFAIELRGDKSSHRIDGSLLYHEKRKTSRGRGSTGTVTVDLYGRRYLVSLDEVPQKLHVISIDAGIPHLQVSLVKSWLPLRAMAVIGGVLLLLALYFDARLSTRRNQTYFTILTSFLLVTGASFFQSATPSSLVRNLMGATMMGALVGVIGGMVLSGIARNLLKPADG
jgi:hypothetical protein